MLPLSGVMLTHIKIEKRNLIMSQDRAANISAMCFVISVNISFRFHQTKPRKLFFKASLSSLN